MSVIKWLMLLPLKLAAMLAAVLLAPLVAAVSMLQKTDTLTGWLAWMQTADNSLDALWQQEQHLSSYSWLPQSPDAYQSSTSLRWLARTLWLIRNPAAGLSDMLGYESAGQPVRVWAQRGEWDSGSTNWLVQSWPGAFQVRAQLFYTSKRFVRINIGWFQSTRPHGARPQ